MANQYQLMIRVIDTKTKEVISDKKEMCIFPNNKNVIRKAAKRNGCYKIGKNLIRHSYAKLV